MTETDEARQTSRVIDRHNRVLFEGQRDDALDYVENNFPHIHVEPGSSYADGPQPDVTVHHADDTTSQLIGGNWSHSDDADDDDDNNDEGEV